MPKQALIYCRVSSVLQRDTGHGLEGQEHRCRAYCLTKGHEIEHVFHDSFTGGGDFMLRPAMRALIEYIDAHPTQDYVVVFDDLKRFARDVVNHLKLRRALDTRGVTVACPNFTFEDTPEGDFVETILAAGAELERKQNKRQVVQKMKARLEAGYWTFNSEVTGFERKNLGGRDWILTRKEPEASMIQEVFERYADGRLLEQKDVASFLQSAGYKKYVYLEQVKRILTRSLYAGYIEYEKWGVERREGKHEAIVSKEVFHKVQDKLAGKTFTFVRKDVNEDFPLRGFLSCATCEHKFTASWSKGTGAHYAYYRCNNKQCMFGTKSLSKSSVEANYGSLLQTLEPKKNIVNLAEAIALDTWKEKESDAGSSKNRNLSEIEKIRKEIKDLSQRAVRVKSETVASAYEIQIDELVQKERSLIIQVQRTNTNRPDFGTALNEVLGYVKNPYDIWDKGDINDKRLVTRLTFVGELPYHYESGFGTTTISPALRFFEVISTSGSQDVEMVEIESTSENVHSHESTVRSLSFDLN